MIQPPWTVDLTRSEHDLVLFGLVAAGLALLATLVRVRFAPQESHGSFRVASLTANAVVAIAFVSYVALVAAFLLGYREADGVYRPGDGARLAWELRYADWVVTVPLLVIELVAVSALAAPAAVRVRRLGMASAVGMILSGALGAFIVADGTDRTAYTVLGLVGAAFFAVLYALFLTSFRTSLPRLPPAARPPYRTAVILLLVVWFAYPVVYGFLGVAVGGAAAAAGQLALCVADLVAKIGFGGLVHRTAVLRSRNEESLDPSTVRRPRAAQNDSIYVDDSRRVDFEVD